MIEQLLSRFRTAEEEEAFMHQLAEEHPYFTPAQFYRLQRAQPGTESHSRLTAINAVLFNNNRWLHFKLSEFMAPASTSRATAEGHVPEPVPATEVEETAGATATAQDIAELVAATDETAPEEISTTETGDGDTERPDMPAEQPVATDPAPGDAGNEYTEEENPEPDGMTAGEDQPVPVIPAIRPVKEGSLLSFEPYHTVDYFASLGIKLSEEIKSGDKLGIQLRSFTDWLKSMKKVHDLPKETAINDATQQAIQHIAEKSNTHDDVLTEAMAEVYLQQGKLLKARQVYEKLSLLNPSKSAFFAAKIENLKGN